VSRVGRWARAVRRLGPRDVVFVARAGVVATAAEVLLWRASMPTVARWVTRRGPVRGPLPSEDRLVRLTDRLLALDVGPLRPNCVLRSLVLLRYLPGDDLCLRVGVRPQVRPVDGHAWLERDGLPVAEATDPRPIYQETWSWVR